MLGRGSLIINSGRKVPNICRRHQSSHNLVGNSNTNSGSTSTNVVSRRAWQQWRAKNPLPEKPRPEFKKMEEKPWPRSMQILGYSAMVLGIPYSIGWYLSSDHDLREMLGLPEGLLDALRKHFGDVEVVPWEELRDSSVEKHSKFDDEEPYEVRKQQNLIEGLNQEETVVHFTKDGVTETKRLLGSELATLQNLKITNGVALDFEDIEAPSDDLEQDVIFQSGLPTSEYQVYSSWFYQPPTEEVIKTQKSMSNIEVEIARAQYQIQQLEQELQDINSTRDMDDMRAELSKARSTLSSLRWKRRLGMA